MRTLTIDLGIGVEELNTRDTLWRKINVRLLYMFMYETDRCRCCATGLRRAQLTHISLWRYTCALGTLRRRADTSSRSGCEENLDLSALAKVVGNQGWDEVI